MWGFKVMRLWGFAVIRLYEDKIVVLWKSAFLNYSARKKALEKQLGDYKDACIEGINTLLHDGKAGQQLYDHFGHSTEVLAQIIEAINEAADKTLTLDNDLQALSKYDAEN